MKGSRRQKKEKGGEADINLIIQAFSKCRRKNGTISTDHYLCACNELVCLFRPLGRGFRLAMKDVSRATRILEIRRVSCAGSHCQSLDTMLDSEYEYFQKQGEMPVRGPVKYGAQSLKTLYYGMEFILKFMLFLKEAYENDKPFKGRDKTIIYQDTLGWTQSHFQQATIRLALLRSSGRRRLISKLEPSCHGVAPVCTLIDRCILVANPIQRRVGEFLGILSDGLEVRL